MCIRDSSIYCTSYVLFSVFRFEEKRKEERTWLSRLKSYSTNNSFNVAAFSSSLKSYVRSNRPQNTNVLKKRDWRNKNTRRVYSDWLFFYWNLKLKTIGKTEMERKKEVERVSRKFAKFLKEKVNGEASSKTTNILAYISSSFRRFSMKKGKQTKLLMW